MVSSSPGLICAVEVILFHFMSSAEETSCCRDIAQRVSPFFTVYFVALTFDAPPWDRGITRTVLGWMVRGVLDVVRLDDLCYGDPVLPRDAPDGLALDHPVDLLLLVKSFALPPLPAGITMVLPVRRPSRSDMRFALAMACTVVECLLASE